jgi:hypothetical protein
MYRIHLPLNVPLPCWCWRKAGEGRGVALPAFPLLFEAGLEEGLVFRS